MKTRRPTAARLFAGLAPFLLVGLSLPLLAPSCGDFEPGVKTFAKGSLVIPMDVCYQCTRQAADALDTATANCTRTGYVSAGGKPCPQALSQGDVIKAYGLVYQLIRNDVAVYWVIDPTKPALDGYDLAIQYAGGFPVLKLDWATGQAGASPTAADLIRYMGGPFVVDGSDAAKAIAVMQANRTAFGAVNVHVASVAFQANVAKTMAGGWSAGGAVAPKLALLDIGSGNLSKRTTAPSSVCGGSGSPTCVLDVGSSPQTWTCIGNPRNAEPVIREYLAKAGIGTGTSGGTPAGPHGEIYDRLSLADFLPAAGSTDWRTSAFGRGGYQILWVPHWVAPGSCSDFSTACRCLATRATPAQIDQVLATVGAFSAGGGDVFAECAGLGSFEGAFPEGNLTSTGYSADYQDGDPTTRFQTRTGVRFNVLPTNPFPAPSYTPDGVANFASPLMQLGDFPFKPYTGAIEDYKPDDTAAADRNYQPGVARLIGVKHTSGSPATERDWDFFTFRDKSSAAPVHGSIVYLGGHSYSGVQGSFQAAGSRLVLNTLFNLGAGCTASGVACDTGQFGACSRGVLTCNALGERVCTSTAAPQPEACNGLDDDCDGFVDEELEQGCYSGPAGTQGVGLCRAGTRTCQQAQDGSYGFTACQGEVDPTPESCNGFDDDCDGEVDEVAPGVPLSESCYFGPPGTAGVGICRAGTSTCNNGILGACDDVTPAADLCAYAESHGGGGVDADCNGQLDPGCADCPPTTTRACYNGPAGTAGVGLCRNGVQTCDALGHWGTACAGEVTPAAVEICRNDVDENCNGLGDDDPPFCLSCQFRPSATDPSRPDLATTEKLDCWTGPAAAVFKSAQPSSVCVRGFQFCQASGQFGGCEQQTLPGPELCNGRDDDCDGTVDEGAECGAGFSCENGVCVESGCDGVERLCREGYQCFASRCIVTSCGGGGACAAGTQCSGGSCADPCDPAAIQCGAGSTCAGGYCTGGACYAVGCPQDQLCQNGACTADRCSGVICPAGTFCRQGDCVQACAITTCGSSEKCDPEGFCVADPCAGKSCSPTQACVDGTCQLDRCVGIACGTGQRCQDGVCLDDPCTGVTCPVGQCRDGQCFATHRSSSAGGAAPEQSGGCGCGAGGGSPLALLGLLLALPLARRRRGRRGAAPLALLVAAGLGATGCTKEEAPPFDPTSCAALAVPLATCEAENRCIDHFNDPSHCGACGVACGAGNWCVDGTCAPASAVAPRLTSVAPPSGSVGGLAPVELTLTGERFDAGATLRATGPAGTVTVPTERLADGRLRAQLDLSQAAPGTWALRVVNPNLVISNSRGFGVAIPTPSVTGVVPIPDASPGSATPRVAAGGQRTLRLVGTGLMIGSACKISGATLPEQEVPSTLTAAGLECELDLAAARPGAYEVWVVNDASHVSPRRPWEVVSAAPVLDSIGPSSLALSPPWEVTFFGSGFDITSKAWLIGPGFAGGLAQSTSFVDSTRLVVAFLDLEHCPSSPCLATDATHRYTLQVRNGAAASAEREVFIEAGTRTVTAMSPQTAWQGDQPTLTITGNGLTGGVLEFRPPGGAFQDAASQVVSGTGDTVSGVVDLIGTPAGSAPAGTWDVRLRFPPGNATTRAFTLRVDSNQAVITATPQPAGGTAGLNVAVVLAASNLRPPLSGVRVRFYDPTPPPPPAVPFTLDLVPSATPTTTVQAVLPLAGLQTKVYALSVVNPNGAAPSAPYNFTVLPGQPTVTAVACTNVTGGPPGCTSASSARQQGTPVPIRIDGTNFAKPDAAGNNGSQVRVSAPSIGVQDQLLPPAAVTVTSGTRIDVQLDTTLAVPASYAISVWNQGGAQRSGALPNAFTILP